jgi:hypothetical protein
MDLFQVKEKKQWGMPCFSTLILVLMHQND